MAESATPRNDSPAARRGRRGRTRLHPLAWWPLPVCAVLGLGAGAAYGVLKAPEYAATAYVIAVPDDTTEPATALGFSQAYARIATSQSTLAYAQPRSGLTAQKLRTQVRAETSPESPMIAITGTARKAAEAADIANAVADALTLSSNQQAKNTGVQLLLFNQALAPTAPASPSAPISGAVGLCAGGLIGGLALLARPRRRHPDQDGAVVPEPAAHPSLPSPAQGDAAEAAAVAAVKESVR